MQSPTVNHDETKRMMGGQNFKAHNFENLLKFMKMWFLSIVKFCPKNCSDMGAILIFLIFRKKELMATQT